VSYEVGGRSICLADFRQPTGAGRLSFSRLSRTSLSGFGVWRHLARLNLARDEKLGSTEKGQDVEKIANSSRTSLMDGLFRDGASWSSLRT
jgi:hypothetical protein